MATKNGKVEIEVNRIVKGPRTSGGYTLNIGMVLHQQLSDCAKDLGVSVGQLGRALILYGLKNGNFSIKDVPVGQGGYKAMEHKD